ncbi:MAG TPA: hypothetical protein VJO33_19365 [Gemmatimonadaceae bacterium]|nr:hypothetical protein [Gemmatimonadaceae bacterium]
MSGPPVSLPLPVSLPSSLAAEIELVEAEAWAELQLSLAPEFRKQYGIQVQRVGGAVLLLATGSSTLAINRVIGLGFTTPLNECQLDGIIAAYASAGVERFVIQWSPEAIPLEATEWFAQRGYRLVSKNVKVYRRAGALPNDPTIDSRLRVKQIGPEDAETFERIVARPLGVPEGLGPGIRSTIGRREWRFYLVHDDARPIAGAALYTRGKHAWCGLGATIESDRKRGAQTALLARRLSDAAALGCEWVSADTVAETADRPNSSYRNMRRVGFSELYERPNFLVQHRI